MRAIITAGIISLLLSPAQAQDARFSATLTQLQWNIILQGLDEMPGALRRMVAPELIEQLKKQSAEKPQPSPESTR